MQLEQTQIVLVETTHPGNIGATARAMKTMGLSRLVLVAPQCSLAPRAFTQAAHARDIVANARIVDSVTTALADCSLVLGTSSRNRKLPWPLLRSNELGVWLNNEIRNSAEKLQGLAIMFGREAHGLTNTELQLCHAHIEIPTCEAYRVLNVAMAVQVITYELRLAILNKRTVSLPDRGELAVSPDWETPAASHGEVEYLLRHIDELMLQINFYDPGNARQLPNRIRRLFQRLRLDKMEVGFFRGFLRDIQRNIQSKANPSEKKQASVDLDGG